MSDLIAAGLIAFWGWQVLNMDGPLTWLRDLLMYLPFGAKLVVCPYCIGAWFALVSALLLDLATHDVSWLTPLTGLAAAGLVGLVGSFVPVDTEEMD